MSPRPAGGIAHWDDVEPQLVDRHGMRARWSNLGHAAGSVTIGVRRQQIEPGCRPTPPHSHSAEEELTFVLGGSGLCWQDGTTYEIRAGDCLLFRPGEEAHTLRGGDDGLDVLVFGQRIWAETGLLPRANVAWLGATWVTTGGDHPWAQDEAAGPLEFPPPSPRAAGIVNVADVEPWRGGQGQSRIVERDLADAAGGAENCAFFHVELEPGATGYPPHCHSAVEELFVVLDGEGTFQLMTHGLETTDHPVRRGSVIARPAGTGVAHSFRAGDAGLSYLAFGPLDPNDIAYFPRSKKVFLRGIGVIGRIEPLGFWDGEA